MNARTRRQTFRALVHATVVAALVAPLSGCLLSPSESQQGSCPSYEDASSRARIDLVASPARAQPGALITVGRADRGLMDFGIFTLFGNASAGCRTFILSFDATGPRWDEVTGEGVLGFSGMVNPAASSTEYRMPDIAEQGAYLLCDETVTNESMLCAEVTI